MIHQSDVFAGLGDQSGLGDLISSLFLSPSATVKGLILCVGPIVLYQRLRTDISVTESGAQVIFVSQKPR
jgi:hypothetical protein